MKVLGVLKYVQKKQFLGVFCYFYYKVFEIKVLFTVFFDKFCKNIFLGETYFWQLLDFINYFLKIFVEKSHFFNPLPPYVWYDLANKLANEQLSVTIKKEQILFQHFFPQGLPRLR